MNADSLLQSFKAECEKAAPQNPRNPQKGSYGGNGGNGDRGGHGNGFPIHAFPPTARSMAEEIARVTTSRNLPLAAVSVLGFLSASVGGGIEVATGGGRRTRGNLFLLAVAESGTGKGENFSLASGPFEEIEAETAERWTMTEKPRLTAELAIAEKRTDNLVKEAAKETDPNARAVLTAEYQEAEQKRAELHRLIDSPPCFRVGDVTKEKLATLIQGQPGEALASVSSEARGVLSIIKGRYSDGGDEDLYCSAYSGDAVTVHRVHRDPVSLRRPCLSVLWMIQPDAAADALTSERLNESGMIPRFITFDARAEPEEIDGFPDPIADFTLERWRRLIRDLVTTYRNRDGDPAIIEPSPEARDIMVTFTNEAIRRRRRDGDLRDLAKYCARWAENAWKLAVVLHAAKHGKTAMDETLDEGTAENAVTLMRWFIREQLLLLDAGRREKLHARLIRLQNLIADSGGEITLRHLRKNHGFDDEEVHQLHDMFPGKFYITKITDTGGAPKTVATHAKPEDKTPITPKR